MANMKYFADIGGQTVALTNPPYTMRNVEFEARFPGVRGIRVDSFSRMVADHGTSVLPVTRRIEFKRNPSLHKCDARCMSATGRKCECSCHGKNHGAGAFSCIAA